MKHPAIIPPLALAAALALPLPVPAQTENEGRLEDTILSEEDRGETRLGEEAWETRFQGLFAVDGACGDPDAVWAFAPGSVDMGRTICTSLGKMTWEDGELLVPMSDCQRMGEDVEEMEIALRRESESVIILNTGDEELRLEACEPPLEEE